MFRVLDSWRWPMVCRISRFAARWRKFGRCSGGRSVQLHQFSFQLLEHQMVPVAGVSNGIKWYQMVWRVCRIDTLGQWPSPHSRHQCTLLEYQRVNFGKMQRRPLRAVAPILIPVAGGSNGIEWYGGCADLILPSQPHCWSIKW